MYRGEPFKISSKVSNIEGSAVISAVMTYPNADGSEGSEKATERIRVKSHSMSDSELVLLTGNAKTLSITPKPSHVEWSSFDEEIATVDENGVVTAVKTGTTDILAEINGVYRMGCKVTVTGASGNLNNTDGTIDISDKAADL